MTLIWLALAGALGTIARYKLYLYIQAFKPTHFPLGTLVVNGLGCFLFGFISMLAQKKGWISPHLKMLLLVGFMGAFTTFSTFAFETGQMIRSGQWFSACLNLALQNGLCIFLLFFGMKLGT